MSPNLETEKRAKSSSLTIRDQLLTQVQVLVHSHCDFASEMTDTHKVKGHIQILSHSMQDHPVSRGVFDFSDSTL
jgi:hypothetical protein